MRLIVYPLYKIGRRNGNTDIFPLIDEILSAEIIGCFSICVAQKLKNCGNKVKYSQESRHKKEKKIRENEHRLHRESNNQEKRGDVWHCRNLQYRKKQPTLNQGNKSSFYD